MGRRVAVLVDSDICVGNAMCRAAAPSVFVEGPDRQSTVADPSAASLEALLEIAADCPVGAIFITDADTGEPIDY